MYDHISKPTSMLLILAVALCFGIIGYSTNKATIAKNAKEIIELQNKVEHLRSLAEQDSMDIAFQKQLIENVLSPGIDAINTNIKGIKGNIKN